MKASDFIRSITVTTAFTPPIDVPLSRSSADGSASDLLLERIKPTVRVKLGDGSAPAEVIAPWGDAGESGSYVGPILLGAAALSLLVIAFAIGRNSR